MKFLFFTDPHIKGSNPKARKDNYFQTALEKINEVSEIAEIYGVEAVINGGDLYDIPDVASSVERETARVLTKFDHPILSVLGNHCLFGQNPETFHRSSISVLEGANLIKRLSIESPFIFKEKDFKVAITGCDYHYNLDKYGNISDYISKKPKGVDVLVHVVHGFLSNHDKWHENINYTLIDNILHSEADIILTGHEHTGYGVIKKGNKYFCNPGALLRVSASLKEIDRIPQVALITILPEYINIELVPIKCAKPGLEVLDREALVKEIEKKRSIETFKNSLLSFNVEFTNIYEIAEKIAEKENVPEAVKKEAIKRMQVAEEKINQRG